MLAVVAEAVIPHQNLVVLAVAEAVVAAVGMDLMEQQIPAAEAEVLLKFVLVAAAKPEETAALELFLFVIPTAML